MGWASDLGSRGPFTRVPLAAGRPRHTRSARPAGKALAGADFLVFGFVFRFSDFSVFSFSGFCFFGFQFWSFSFRFVNTSGKLL